MAAPCHVKSFVLPLAVWCDLPVGATGLPARRTRVLLLFLLLLVLL